LIKHRAKGGFVEKSFLIQAVVFLAAAAIAAPLAKRLKVGSVLGYLMAGILIGPSGLGVVYGIWQVESILHIAELGVVLLLFLIGLELKPKRLWTMRRAVFGAGSTQLLLSSLALLAAGLLLGFTMPRALIIALALSLSSTAFVLQVLEEKGELNMRHGRVAFSILLFQDLAAIPIIALVPAFALGGEAQDSMTITNALIGLGTIAVVVVIGRFVLGQVYKLVAASGVREAMTASALLTVVGVALLMEMAGLSAALGAFIAGALLADSEYRHQIQADLEPFEGLLLGLFFTAIGMSLNLRILSNEPLIVFGLVAALLAVKGGILYFVGRMQGLDQPAARRLALAVSQGGEFAFVILAAALGVGVIDRELMELLSVVVTLSMVATPLLLLADDALTSADTGDGRDYDVPPEAQGHVVIAGFGRFGQITARVLAAKGIHFTALDNSPEQVDFVKRFGNNIYYGDASRLDILRAAQVDKARALVLSMGDVELSLKTAEVVLKHFPGVPIYARARDRRHAHRLMDIGVEIMWRETFYSAIELTKSVLHGLGYSTSEARAIVETFADHDRRRLYDEYRHYNDMEKVRAGAMKEAEELEQLFREDAAVEAELAEADN